MASERMGGENVISGLQGNPEQVIADGGTAERLPQIADVESVFGKPYEVGGKTLIPVAELRRFAMGRARGINLRVRPVAVIEVENGQVRIVRVPHSPLPVIIGGMMLGAWNMYWILRTVREWRARRPGD